MKKQNKKERVSKMVRVFIQSFLKTFVRILFNVMEFIFALIAAFYMYNYVITWNRLIAIIGGVLVAAFLLEITSWLKEIWRIWEKKMSMNKKEQLLTKEVVLFYYDLYKPYGCMIYTWSLCKFNILKSLLSYRRIYTLFHRF